jgi:Carboxypeptidase regulatory-like domain
MKCPVLILIFLLADVAFAQTESARLSGRVTDLSGAVIVCAECKITNIETNVSTSTTTNEDGIYVIPDLRPAIYRLTIQKEGFRTVVQPSLHLYVQDAVNENFTLAVGLIRQLKAAQMDREHMSGMLINAREVARSQPPLVEWI